MAFIRNALLTFVTTSGISIVNFLTSILLARTFGPTGRGFMVTVLLWPVMLSWAGNLSLGAANTFFAAGEPATRRQLVANSLWYAGTVGTLVGVVSAFALPLLIPLTPEQHRLLVISLLCLPLSMYAELAQTVLIGAGRFDCVNLTRSVAPTISLVSLILLWSTGTITLTSAVTASWLGGFSAAFLVIYFVIRDGYIAFRPDLALLRRSISYAVRIHLGSLAYLANARLDQLLLTALVAPRALGLYALAVTASEMLNQVANAVALVLTPKIAGQGADEAGQRALATKSVRWVLLIGVLGATILFVIAPPLIRLFWGHRFVAALPVLRVLLPGTIALGVGAALNASLRGAGKPLPGTVAEAISLAISIPLLLLLLPHLGIFGAGLAASIGYGVNCLVLAGFFSRHFGPGSLRELRPGRRDWDEARRLIAFLGRYVGRTRPLLAD